MYFTTLKTNSNAIYSFLDIYWVLKSTLNSLLNLKKIFLIIIQELIVGSDIKEILGKRPEDRTEEEIQQVLFALRTYETFAEYPLNMQVCNDRKSILMKYKL